MNRDAYMTFSKEQEILSDGILSSLINLGAIRDVGTGALPLYFYSYVTTAFTDSGNNSNMTLTLQTDAIEAFNSATNTITLGVFATNSAVGTKIGPIMISPGKADEQWLGVLHTVGGGNFTTAKITSFLSHDPHVWSARPDAITVSVP